MFQSTNGKKFQTVTIGGLVIIAFVIIGIFLTKKNSNLLPLPSGNTSDVYPVDESYFDDFTVKTPTTVFDVTATVPNTSIRYSYPKKGFYDAGATSMRSQSSVIITREFIGGVQIDPTSTSEKLTQNGELVRLGIDVTKKYGPNEDIEAVVSTLPQVFTEQDLSKSFYKTINERTYFFVRQSGNSWMALTIEKDQLVTVVLVYPGAQGNIEEIDQRNGKLLVKVLEQLRFE